MVSLICLTLLYNTFILILQEIISIFFFTKNLYNIIQSISETKGEFMSKTSLSKSELEIMQYIWSINSEVTATDIRQHFSDKNWSKQSVGTFLKRLVKSNFLKIRQESLTKYYYSATMTEQEYSVLPAKTILKNVFNNSLSKFACALFSNDVSDDDIQKLETLLSTYEKELSDKKGDTIK